MQPMSEIKAADFIGQPEVSLVICVTVHFIYETFKPGTDLVQ